MTHLDTGRLFSCLNHNSSISEQQQSIPASALRASPGKGQGVNFDENELWFQPILKCKNFYLMPCKNQSLGRTYSWWEAQVCWRTLLCGGIISHLGRARLAELLGAFPCQEWCVHSGKRMGWENITLGGKYNRFCGWKLCSNFPSSVPKEKSTAETRAESPSALFSASCWALIFKGVCLVLGFFESLWQGSERKCTEDVAAIYLEAFWDCRWKQQWMTLEVVVGMQRGSEQGCARTNWTHWYQTLQASLLPQHMWKISSFSF